VPLFSIYIDLFFLYEKQLNYLKIKSIFLVFIMYVIFYALNLISDNNNDKYILINMCIISLINPL